MFTSTRGARWATALVAAGLLTLSACSSGSSSPEGSSSSSAPAASSEASSPAGSDAPSETAAASETEAASSTAPADAAGPVKGGNLNVRLQQDPGSLDSVFSSNAGTTYISREIFESLVIINANFEPTGVLASSWDVSDDAKTYTFHLRPGVVFSDGSPLTSKDVVASLTDWTKNSGYAEALKNNLDALEAPDDATVVIKLKEPMNVVALMAYSTGSQIHKADLVTGKPETGIPNDKVIGTGPYKLKSWNPGQEIVLERNDKYTPPDGESSGLAGAKGAYLDTITYQIIADDDAAFNALQSGTIDVMGLSSPQYDMLKDNPDFKIGIQAAGSIVHVATNQNSQSIFSKPEARDALNLVIDKQAIIAAQGAPELNIPSNGAFAAQQSPLYSEAGKAKWEEHDAAKAKELFDKAGYKPGQVLHLLTTDEFPMFKDALVQLQQDLKAIGVESEISAYDFGTMIGIKNNEPGKWDLLSLMDDSFPPVPDYTDNVKDMNNAGYPRDLLIPLFSAYNSATTDDARKAAVDDIQKFTAEHLPTITLYDMRTAMGFTPKLQGYDGWAVEFANTWLSQE